MILNLTSGKSKIPVYEFAESSSAASSALYNPDGIEVGFGYDAKKSNGGELRTFYGGLENNSEIIYTGIEVSPGLHNIHLNRPLAEGEKIIINWKTGPGLVVYCENGVTKVKRRTGGTYNEIGKWNSNDGSSENTSLFFDDDVNTKRFDYIETVFFEEIK